MIEGNIKGRVEFKQFSHRPCIFTGGSVVEQNVLKEYEDVDKYLFETVIPQVGELISIGTDKKAEIIRIEWTDGNEIDIITNHISNVIVDDKTEQSKADAEKSLEEWKERIKVMEEERKKIWAYKPPQPEIQPKKGWFRL